MTTSHDTAQRTAPFAVGRHQGAFHAFAAVLLAASVFLATMMPRTGSGIVLTFKLAASPTPYPDLTKASNYTGASPAMAPNGTTDVALNSTATTLVINAASLSMQSLNNNNGVAYTIQNQTTGATNSTLTLGNPAGFTDGVGNASANDLIYVASAGSALTIQGLNGSTGTGTLGVALASSGNFDINGTAAAPDTLTVSAVISGSTFGITKTGAGTLNLGAANTFTGGFLASAGTTNLTADGALAAVASFKIGNGATVSSAHTGQANLINDVASVTINGTGSLNLTGGTETVGSLAGGSTNANALAIGDYNSQAGSFTVGNDNTSTTFSGIISGTRASAGAIFTKQGTGTLNLSGANTFSGVVALNGGALVLGAAESAGTSGPLGTMITPGAITFGGGTLQYALPSTGITPYDYSPRFSTAANQAYSIDTNGNPVTFLAALTSSGGTLNKLGSGILTLSGANTFTGGVTITAGTLSLGSAENAGSGPLGTGTITFAGGTLQYTAANQYDYSSRFSSAAGQNIRIATNSQIVTFATPLTSSGGTLIKSGPGTLVLNDANTFSGGVTLSGGAVSLASAENPGVSGPLGTGTITLNGGTLEFSANNTFDYSPRFSTAASQAYIIDTNGQNVTLATALTSASGSLTKTGVLGFPPAGSQSGAGTLTVSGANTFSGPVNINGGILALGSAEGAGAGPLGNGSSTNVINFAGGTLQYSAVNQTDYSARFNTASTTQAYSVDTNSQNVTFASNLTSANGTFTKVGAGILTLTGANTYAGGTTVNGGVLQISNASGTSATGSGAVMVVAGAALRGTGYIDAGPNTITVNGTLSPGSVTNSPGTITLGVNGSTGALTLASTSTLAFHISSVNSQDLVALSGSTALALNGGTLALVLPDTTATGIDYTATYPLFTGVGSLTGGFGSVTGYDSTDYAASFALDGTEYDLSFVAVPEPSTMYAAALLAGGVVWHQRRRWSPAG